MLRLGGHLLFRKARRDDLRVEALFLIAINADGNIIGNFTKLLEIGMLGEMGVSEASVVRYTHSRIEEFRREVRIEAVKNARSIAEELVGALGQNLGGAVLIVDNGFYETSPIPIYRTRSMLAGAVYSEAAVDAGAQNLDMQEITLTYNVMVKFVLRH